MVEQAIPLAMAERVEVIVDFSAYPLNTTVTLDDQNAPLAERSSAIHCRSQSQG